MGVQERKAREKEELRREILTAACDLFDQQGYEAVSMRKIADKIEYSPTTIYLHFRDKADLFDCLCADVFMQLVARLEAITSHYEDPLAGLRAGLRCYIDFGLEHPAHYRVTFMTPCVPTEEEASTRSREMGERAFECLVNGVAACVQAGRIAPQDPMLGSQALWTAVHGLTSLLITDKQFPWVDRETLIDKLLDTLLEGLKAK